VLPKLDVTLPPKDSVDFVVALVPRFSEPVEACRALMAQRCGIVRASYMA
jgi:hypothetical protein